MDVAVSFPADTSLSSAELKELLQNSINTATADGKLAERDIDTTKDATVTAPEKGTVCIIVHLCNFIYIHIYCLVGVFLSINEHTCILTHLKMNYILV